MQLEKEPRECKQKAAVSLAWPKRGRICFLHYTTLLKVCCEVFTDTKSKRPHFSSPPKRMILAATSDLVQSIYRTSPITSIITSKTWGGSTPRGGAGVVRLAVVQCLLPKKVFAVCFYVPFFFHVARESVDSP